MNELQIWLALILNQRLVLSRKTRIVFDGIIGVQAEIFQIELVFRIRLVEKAGGEVGDEEAERGGEVEGLADLGVELFEGDVLAVVGKDAVVCCANVSASLFASSWLLRLTHGIQHRAC